MEAQKEICGMLDLIISPGFCVKNEKIVKVNPAAQGLFLSPGDDLEALLLTGQEEYRQFSGGCLYLNLSIAGQPWGASVTRMEDVDVFLLEPDTGEQELRTAALAARELRDPLSGLIAITDTLLPRALPEESPKVTELLSRMSRGLYQMQRILGNMSDAGRGPGFYRQETRNINQVFAEIFDKAGALMEHTGVHLRYKGLRENVSGLISEQQMERAVLNILSNAIKFTPQGGSIEARLLHRGNMLQLSIQDSGSGIAEEVLGSVFTRYLRQPGLEDSRCGIGLGMVLVRSAALHHGGTVLIDQPGGHGTRVTMTMQIRRDAQTQVHSLVTDLSGGRDQGLIELSQFLPFQLYETEK